MTTDAQRLRDAARQSGPALAIGGGVVALILVIVLGIGWYRGTEHEVTATVDSKERVCESSREGGQSCEYRVFTDHGVFKVTDTFVYWRFNSSDTYASIKQGATYRFRVVGVRAGWMSSYENIIGVSEVRR